MEEKQEHIEHSKKLEIRHNEIKGEMLKIVDAIGLLEEEYNNLQQELYSVEQEYMKNLQNLVE